MPEDFEEHKHIKVFIMCDSYIGLDQEYTIDINKVNEIIAKKNNKASTTSKAATA